MLLLVCVPALGQHGDQTVHSTQTSNILCFWESEMDLDLIEAVDPKQWRHDWGGFLTCLFPKEKDARLLLGSYVSYSL